MTADQEALARRFLLSYLEECGRQGLEPRYNIAPGQDIAVVREKEATGERVASHLSWGLVPFWAQDAKSGFRMINARSETAAEKPAFRKAMKYRRCLIPASGFYEWKREGRFRQPYYFHPAEDSLFGFAGLWEANAKVERGGEWLSCCVLTTGANRLMEPVHHRMPVILHPEDYAAWLDPQNHEVGDLLPLLKPLSPSRMKCHAVSPEVNRVGNDHSGLVRPYQPVRQENLFS